MGAMLLQLWNGRTLESTWGVYGVHAQQVNAFKQHVV